MGRFINPFTDMGFKRIFGQEVNKNLLIDFLNDLLEGEKRIIDITFLDKEQLGTSVDDRSCNYDIYCENENGERFIVEIQNRGHRNFKERAIYYLSRAIANQGQKGPSWIFDLKAVYGVFFMNFHLDGRRQARFRTDIDLRDMRTNEPFSDKMRFIFLDLPAFTKDEETCETDFERWIYVLKNMEILQRSPSRNASRFSRSSRKSPTYPPSRRRIRKNMRRLSRSTGIILLPNNGRSRKGAKKAFF